MPSERLFRFSGVNLPQYTDGAVPGRFGVEYSMPTTATLDAFQKLGLNTVHALVQWERVQPGLATGQRAVDQVYLERMDAFAVECGKRKLTMVIGLRSFAEYNTPSGPKYLGTGIPSDAFFELWVDLANRYSRHDAVIFDLMNEPKGYAAITTETWRKAAQLAVAGIRTAGFTKDILVCGNGYSSARGWTQNWYGTPNSVEMVKLTDPMNRLLYNVHMYMDADGSGEYKGTGGVKGTGDVVSLDQGVRDLEAVTTWARGAGKKLYLGEFGTPNAANGKLATERTLQFLSVNRDVWQGWSWWCAAPWASYALNLGAAAEKPQAAWLGAWV